MTEPTDDEYAEHQLEELERAQRFSRPIIDRAERIYSQSLNGLWIGNAGAAIASLSFMGSIISAKPELAKALVIPFLLFVAGLIAMGLGAVIVLVREGARAKRMERVSSVLGIVMGDIVSPTEAVGLALRDPRTISAVIGALTFLSGCLWGATALVNSI